MSGEQLEYAVMVGVGIFCTMVGTGRLRLGGEHATVERSKATMRKVGPLLVICGGLLIVSSYLR